MDDTGIYNLDIFTDNLLNLKCDECSVAKVYELNEPRSFYGSFNNDSLILVWEREQEVKELSVEQISKLLGYKVKVVK